MLTYWILKKLLKWGPMLGLILYASASYSSDFTLSSLKSKLDHLENTVEQIKEENAKWLLSKISDAKRLTY